MDEPELPTVHLNEKILRTIRERERLDNKNASCSKTTTRKDENTTRKNRKAPKHGFYQAGVTRLSITSEKNNSSKRESQVASSNRENTTKSAEEPKRDVETRKVRRKKNEDFHKTSQFEKADPVEEEEVVERTPMVAAVVEKRAEQQKGGRRQAERLRGSRSGRQQSDRKLYDPIGDEDRQQRVNRTSKRVGNSKARQLPTPTTQSPPPLRNNHQTEHQTRRTNLRKNDLRRIINGEPLDAKRSATKNTAAKRPVAKNTAAKRSAAKNTAVKRPAAKNTAAKRPAAKCTAMKQPATKKLVLYDPWNLYS